MKITNEHKLYLEFSIGCALQILPIYEKKYPNKKEPRLALEAANNFLNAPSKKTQKAAYAAADAAAYAAADIYPAHVAAAYAAYAAYAAAAAYAAYAAAAAAYAQRKWQVGKWQVGFLAYLNFKYSLSVKIRGVE